MPCMVNVHIDIGASRPSRGARTSQMDSTGGLAGPKAKFANSVVETVELVTERFSNSLHQFALIRQRRDAHRTHTQHHPELEN